MRRNVIVGGTLAALGLLLGGCNLLFPPQLGVTPSALELTSAGPQPLLTLANTGASQSSLSWTGSSSNPRVTIAPSSGSLAVGKPQRVAVLVDASGMASGQTLSATITIGSAGGTKDVAVHFTSTTTTALDCGVAPLGIASASAAAVAAPGRTAAPAYVPGQIIVSYVAPGGVGATSLSGGPATTTALRVTSDHGLRVLRLGRGGGPSLLAAADVPAALASLRADPRVRYAQRNYYVRPQRVPTDPCYAPRQWNLYDFGLPQAWDIATGNGAPVVIAIIDTGVQTDHPDLRDKMLPGWNFFASDSDVNPGPGVNHGTHVAGIAAAMGDNLTGIAGVAFGPKVKILPIKIFDDSGQGATSYLLAEAIRWAAGLSVAGVPDNRFPAQIINVSLGVPNDQPSVDDAAQQAWNAGALLVAAAGNHGPGTIYSTDPGIMSPANAPAVIAVGSVDSDYHISAFSDTTTDPTPAAGTGLELMAPGGFNVTGSGGCSFSYNGAAKIAVISSYAGSNYGCDAGTSMSSPFVAGVAALLKSRHPGWTPQQLRNALDTSARFDSGYMSVPEYGYGVLCADKALGATTTCGY